MRNVLYGWAFADGDQDNKTRIYDSLEIAAGRGHKNSILSRVAFWGTIDNNNDYYMTASESKVLWSVDVEKQLYMYCANCADISIKAVEGNSGKIDKYSYNAVLAAFSLANGRCDNDTLQEAMEDAANVMLKYDENEIMMLIKNPTDDAKRYLMLSEYSAEYSAAVAVGYKNDSISCRVVSSGLLALYACWSSERYNGTTDVPAKDFDKEPLSGMLLGMCIIEAKKQKVFVEDYNPTAK